MAIMLIVNALTPAGLKRSWVPSPQSIRQVKSSYWTTWADGWRPCIGKADPEPIIVNVNSLMTDSWHYGI
jgi:hypothetical protein